MSWPYSNPGYSAADNSTIDCMVDHPKYGRIPFTASAVDLETAAMYAAITENAEAVPIASYVAPVIITVKKEGGARPTQVA